MIAGLYPQDREHLHYRTENSKLRNVLSIEVPAVGARRGKEVIERLLAQEGQELGDIEHWIIHPGGEKVLDAMEDRMTDEQVGELVREDVRKQLAVLSNYKRPRKIQVRFVEFEKTTTQKVKRYLYAIDTTR